MGLTTVYWRFRTFANMAGSTLIASLVSFGTKIGAPTLFTVDHDIFTHAAEQMLSVGTSLLGFIIAAVTLIYALTTNERFNILRKSKSYRELAAASRAAIYWLLMASIFGAACSFVAPEVFYRIDKAFVFSATFMAAQGTLSTAALTWVISRLITIA